MERARKTDIQPWRQCDPSGQAAEQLGVDLDETKLAETLRRVAKHDPEKKKDSKGD